MTLDGASINQAELDAGFYGPSTAAAVLAYKRKRDIVNRTYQSQADNIVGIMTIKSLDDELAGNEVPEDPQSTANCQRRFFVSRGDSASVAKKLLSAAQQTSSPGISTAVRDSRRV